MNHPQMQAPKPAARSRLLTDRWRQCRPGVAALLLAALWCSLPAGQPANAQEALDETPADDSAGQPAPQSQASANAERRQAAERRAARERLLKVQTVIDTKSAERKALNERLAGADEADLADLQTEIDQLTQDIDKLRDTLERLATGGADASLFVEGAEVPESDWRQDIALIAKPVLDSLKELTEKPRRISELNEAISVYRKERAEAGDALKALEQAGTDLEPKDEALARSLKSLTATWQKRFNNAQNEIDVAQLQISSLQGDASLIDTLTQSVIAFVKGRGLTLLLAAAAAGCVWLVIRFMMSGYRRKLLDKSEPESRTRYRLAEYSVRAITFLVCLVAVFIVFYERGDVLLLGLLILLIIGLILSARQLLPQYIAEARLLLNVGGMREAERVFYLGLPWRVESINMFTILRNPELSGILRVPLSDLHEVNSRPIVGKETWFPSTRGDMVMIEGSVFAEVLSQTPDTVELKTGGGQRRSIPTAEFYAMSMVNVSRGDVFGVWTVFGLDYDQQPGALDEVPRILREAVAHDIAHSDVAEFVTDILVELKAAGSSSLDFLLFATFDSRAARSYLRIERIMQRACVRACNEQGWSIPFPHLSVVQKPVVSGAGELGTAGPSVGQDRLAG